MNTQVFISGFENPQELIILKFSKGMATVTAGSGQRENVREIIPPIRKWTERDGDAYNLGIAILEHLGK